MLSLQQQIDLIELKNAERLQDPLLKKHIKKWKKPSYSILKERLIPSFLILILLVLILIL